MLRFILAPALTLVCATALAAGGMDSHAGHGGHEGHNMQHGDHAAAAPAKAQSYTATGIVKGLDPKAGKVTIAHDPIPALKWPSMTMRFTYENPAVVKGLRNGDRIRFTFRQEGNVSVLESVRR
ncbi:copper-binding protein [Sutterella sp.]|uniref:copper-binding protein n=1 Tax=Sutterella sp. TaxID=1981025 RepID=UPI0026DF9ED6|nr:copper-binding protein [Sutterella sp.]MDO5531462.1 copper-binding protein [Sutterella sp.]